MARRRPKIPDGLSAYPYRKPPPILCGAARKGDPSYECVGGPLCGNTVVMMPTLTCMVPGTPPGPGQEPGMYVGCRACGVLYFQLEGPPRHMLPCGHQSHGDYGDALGLV